MKNQTGHVPRSFGEVGAAPILILVAIIGIVAFLAIASSAPFQNSLLTSLFPKEQSNAAFTGNTFSETWNGSPRNPDGTFALDAPKRWTPSDWYIAYHGSEDSGNEFEDFKFDSLNPGAQHGHDCSAPPATHPFNGNIDDVLFLCRDHMMSAYYSGGNGYVYMTPPALVDFSNGTATISWDQSTDRTSDRDWVEFEIAPLQYHNPMFGVNGSTALQNLQFIARLNVPQSPCFELQYFPTLGRSDDGSSAINPQPLKCQLDIPNLKPSFTNRTTFQIRINKNQITWLVPAGEANADGTLINNGQEYIIYQVNVNLPFDKATFQMGHGSYNPDKGCAPGYSGLCGNTWHWDNVSISPALPLTILRADKRRMSNYLGHTATFPQNAPANSYLKFTAFGTNLQYSLDNGSTWQNAQKVGANWLGNEHPEPYFTAVPAGTRSVRFRGDNWWGGEWIVKDAAIFSTTAPIVPSSQPTPTPAPSANPSIAPSPSPLPSPSPTPTPAPSVAPSPTPVPSVKPGDTDGDDDVDIFDYNAVLGLFGQTGPNLPADFDKDSDVDIFDYNTILGNFGK